MTEEDFQNQEVQNLMISHSCKRCGKDQQYYFLCTDCQEEISIDLVNSGKVASISDAFDSLYDYEIEYWYRSRGY